MSRRNLVIAIVVLIVLVVLLVGTDQIGLIIRHGVPSVFAPKPDIWIGR